MTHGCDSCGYGFRSEFDGLVSPEHDRMPVILTPKEAEGWIEEGVADRFRPIDDDFLSGPMKENQARKIIRTSETFKLSTLHTSRMIGT